LRRLAAVLLLGAGSAFLMPTLAEGATQQYASPWGGADAVSFGTKTKAGEIVKVQDFAYSGFTFPCNTGPYPFSGSNFQNIAVKNDRFRLDAYGTGPNDPKAVFLGRFNESGTRAHGSFSVKGTFPGPMRCEGSHTWFAKRL
jgi:hypothetical protein